MPTLPSVYDSAAPPQPRIGLLRRCLILAWAMLSFWPGSALLAAPAPSPLVELDAEGHLSVSARDVDVLDLLQRISTLTGIRLVVAGTPPQSLGSWEFSALPLEQGLERILGNIAHAMSRAPGNGTSGAITDLWILTTETGPPGAWPLRAPGTLVAPGSPAEPGAQPDLADLMEQVAAIESGDDPDAVLRLGDLMASPEPAVRSTVAAALARSADPRAPQLLAQLLYGDPDPGVRRDTAEALTNSGNPQAEALLRQAEQDPDPTVRSRVTRLLMRFTPSSN